jgi:hypothetical protein
MGHNPFIDKELKRLQKEKEKNLVLSNNVEKKFAKDIMKKIEKD